MNLHHHHQMSCLLSALKQDRTSRGLWHLTMRSNEVPCTAHCVPTLNRRIQIQIQCNEVKKKLQQIAYCRSLQCIAGYVDLPESKDLSRLQCSVKTAAYCADAGLCCAVLCSAMLCSAMKCYEVLCICSTVHICSSMKCFAGASARAC